MVTAVEINDDARNVLMVVYNIRRLLCRPSRIRKEVIQFGNVRIRTFADGHSGLAQKHVVRVFVSVWRRLML